MKVVVLNQARERVERPLKIGEMVHGLRIEQLIFETGEEVRQVLSGPGFSWMLNLANRHFKRKE